MNGHFRFSHMSGILWECGTAERSEASTALNARTRVRTKKIWQLALPKPERSLGCALHMGIYSDSRRSTYFFVHFLFIFIEPGYYRSFLFIIWLNCYCILYIPCEEGILFIPSTSKGRSKTSNGLDSLDSLS